MQNLREEARVRPGNRLAMLALAALVWALLIFCRLVYLQVVSYPVYKRTAEQQQQRTVSLSAPRGAILDRSGKPLAISVPVDSVCLNPLRVPDRPMAAELLARVLKGVQPKDVLAKMEAAVDEYRRLGKKAKGVGFLWVKRKITREESEALRSLKLDWVEFRQETQRFYPDGALASHVLGGVDFEERGNAGLEKKLDAELRGREGKARVLTDVQQRGIENLHATEAQPGKAVMLTLDERIQFVVERELQAACEKYSASTGSVVVMDPHTGEILAMASYPNYDPNVPPKPDDDPAIRFNQPVSVAFEPGSVFKIVTLSVALETTNLRPETLVNCGRGTITVAGRTVHEAKRGYGTLSMADVLAHSSNVGAIQVGMRVGKENLYRYVKMFGFGERTGIPLPAESAGTIRRPENWHPAAIASIAMGHEISTTTLQLAQATSVIANGGVMVHPRLVLSRQRPGGPLEKEPAPEPKRILKPETAILMRRMMEGVVILPYGTGKAARLQGYTCGGKTGSAQIYDRASHVYTHLYNGSFAGFAPVTNPAVVIAVTLNGVRLFGGVVAAPVYKTIATETLRILEVPKDLPEDLPDQPALDPAEANDLAIAEMASPPDDLPDVAMRMRMPPPTTLAATPGSAVPVVVAPAPAPNLPQGPGAAQAQRSTDTAGMEDRLNRLSRERVPAAIVSLGVKVPNYRGKPMRTVLEESLANGVPIDVVGSGIARAQTPEPGEYLGAGARVRVEFR